MTPLRTHALAAAAAAALLACASKADREPFRLVGVDEVQALLGRPGVAVLDANDREQYAQAHLPGARLVPRGDLGAVLPDDRGATLVFYCSGPR